MRVVADLSAASWHGFVEEHVQPGGTVVTDAWPGFAGSRTSATPASGTASGPTDCGTTTLTRRYPACTESHLWLSAGCWEPTKGRSTRLTYKPHLDEFVFQFNRRSRGLVSTASLS